MSQSSETVSRWLVDLAASSIGTERGFTFTRRGSKPDVYHTFQELTELVARAASRFAEYRPGTRVAIIVPDGQDFILTFLGAMHAGLVPVPIAPPVNIGAFDAYLALCRHIVEVAKPELVVADPRVGSLLGSLLDTSIKEIISPDYSECHSPLPLVDRTADDLAFLQFTSGSISLPKGVSLTHRNLIANSRVSMGYGLKIGSDDLGCSWLPLFHDMGLIGFVIMPILNRVGVVYIPTLEFLRSPLIWLETISKFRASISYAPNFAYGLCTKRVQEAQGRDIDLSSWRVAGCGAEPIQAKTLRNFIEAYRAFGFNSTTFVPSYGLAESTLSVSFAPIDRELKVDYVHIDSLAERGIAEPSNPESDNRAEFVSCGTSFPGHEIQIFKADDTSCQEREVGEILIKGPSVMDGYYENEAATNAVFFGEYYRTGDLGYFADGELYVCGRSKDMVIVAGRNYYPTDIEVAASEVAGVRKGNLVAFGVEEEDGSETVVLCVETREEKTEYERMTAQIRSAVMTSIGVSIAEIVFLPPGTLPKTSSGKLQRGKAKMRFLEGTLDSRQNIRRKSDNLGLLKHWAVSQWSFLRNK